MTYILSIDTTSKHSSISIFKDHQNLIEYNFTNLKDLSTTLFPALDFVFNSTDLQPSDIDVYGVATGPGLFTGIRVGLAALKGLLYEWEKPIVPVLTLQALGRKCNVSQGTTISMIDARRNEIYLAGYNWDNNVYKEIVSPQLINIDEIDAKLNNLENLYFIGSGAEVYQSLIKEKLGKGEFCFSRSHFLAAEICKIAYHQFREGNYTTNLQDLSAIYIRKPDAQKNRSDGDKKNKE